MRLLHVINEVCAAPWLITQEMLSRITEILNARIAGEERMFIGGEPVKSGGLRLDGSVATIPIEGVLANRVSNFEKSCGVRDYSDIAKELGEAGRLARSGAINRLVLEVNTPGGQSVGLPLVSNLVDQFQASHGVPVTAHIVGQAASAGLYLIAGANEIVADPGTNVGSIGAFTAFLDKSKAMEKAGMKLEVISSSELKATMLPGTSLTQPQRAYLQDRIDQAAGDFKDRMRRLRSVPDEAMDGRVFGVSDAKRFGLIDTTTYDFPAYLGRG